MVRASRQVPSVYFGRPGALVTLPWPLGDEDRSYDRLVYDFVSGSGQHQVSSLAQGSRGYSLNWNALHVDNYRFIEQYWVNAMGPGPWVYLDPSVPNLLLPNQASATNTLMDVTGFYTVGGLAADGSLYSNTLTAQIHRTGAIRSLQWQWPVAASTTPTLAVYPPYRNWYGLPVQVGIPYAWSFWTKPDGTVDTSITATAQIVWTDATGAVLSTSAGTTTAVGAWTKLSVTANAPTNAAYAQPRVAVTGSTVLTGASLYLDEFLFEQDSVFNTWAPGTGLRAVEITGLTDAVTFESRMRKEVTLALRELST